MSTPLVLSLLTPLYNLFGWLMGVLYQWLMNYGLVIIVFDVVVKCLIIPLNFKSQRAMLRQQALMDDINEIKRVYGDDVQGAQQAQMELMRASGISMGSSFLPMIFQFLILIAIWQPITRPLFYISGLSPEKIARLGELCQSAGLMDERAVGMLSRSDIPLLTILRNNGQILADAVNQGLIQLNQVLDLDFLSMDLGLKPTLNPTLLFGQDTWRTYVPLLILVAVMMITTFLSTSLSKRGMLNYRTKEEKARERNNPAKRGQTSDAGEGTMRTMELIMPVFMLWTSLTLPSAMTLFWLVSNLIAMLQTYLTNRLYTQPMRAFLAEQKAEKNPNKRRVSS